MNAPRVCVLGSGSSGNCAVVSLPGGRGMMIDAGFSPRRTRALLRRVSFDLDGVGTLLITHLDSDHLDPGWARSLPGHVTAWVHVRHARRGRRLGLLPARCETFDGALSPQPGVEVRAALAAHDESGSAAFRIEIGPEAPATIGYATDVGRAADDLVALLAGVDVLGLESNYCPRLQAASRRPESLKRRIMGGFGHLSNQECAEAVRRIGPGSHVILLHLSRRCNDPDLAAGMHAGRAYQTTVARQWSPTAWIPVTGASASPRPRARDDGLFEVAARSGRA